MAPARNTETRNKTLAFRQLIDQEKANENEVQKFLEENTHFLPTPNLLNHQLHFNCIIRKFPIGDFKTDYAYLTKSSIGWRLVLVELEDSSKPIFKRSSRDAAFSSQFNDAITQIDRWKTEYNRDSRTVHDSLDPLLQPLGGNDVRLHRVLVYGRSRELEEDQKRRTRLEDYSGTHGITVLTYDSLLRLVEAGHTTAKAVLGKNSSGYKLRSVEGEPDSLFAYVMPEHLELGASVEENLISKGYDMKAWKRGERLNHNQKWSSSTHEDIYQDHLHPAAAKILGAMQSKKSSGP